MLFGISVYRFLPLWRISRSSIALQCFLGSAYIDFCTLEDQHLFHRTAMLFGISVYRFLPLWRISIYRFLPLWNIFQTYCPTFTHGSPFCISVLTFLPSTPFSHLLTYHGSSRCPTFACAPPFCVLILICFSSLFSFSTPFSQLFTYYSLYFPSLNFCSSIFLYHVQRFAIGLFNQPLIHISVSSQSQCPLPSSTTADAEWSYASKSIISLPTCSMSSLLARERGKGSCFRVRLRFRAGYQLDSCTKSSMSSLTT